jgi:ribonuclease VapC
MFIDASAIVAILRREPGWEDLEARIEAARSPFFISPLVRFEATLAVARSKARADTLPTPAMILAARKAVDALIEEIGATEMAISSEIGDLALEAAMTYGRAVGHPARLNFGDCYAYACAKSKSTGLLYIGNDFTQTDLA